MQELNVNFENCYGIITSDDYDPEEIVLSFEPFQGKYIKSYPLHESQKILIDNETELRISLYLYETHDLLMELLSYGANLQVIQPKSLIDKMTGVVKDMYKIYSNEKNKS